MKFRDVFIFFLLLVVVFKVGIVLPVVKNRRSTNLYIKPIRPLEMVICRFMWGFYVIKPVKEEKGILKIP